MGYCCNPYNSRGHSKHNVKVVKISKDIIQKVRILKGNLKETDKICISCLIKVNKDKIGAEKCADELPTITTKCIPHRKQFHDAHKEPHECASDWLSRIRELATSCEFGKDTNTFILDKFIAGLDEKFTSQMCLELKTVNIDSSLELVKRYESDTTEKRNDIVDNHIREEAIPNVLEEINIKHEDPNHSSEGLSFDDVDSESSLDGEDKKDIDYEPEYVKQEAIEKEKTFKKEQRKALKKAIVLASSTEPKPPRKYKKRAIKEKQMFECEICHYKNPHECHIRRHKLIHLAEKSFVCHLCGKGFHFSVNLSTHIKRHTGEKCHQCNICQKSFSEPGNLKIHMRKHSGERPFSCSVCGKDFAAKSYVKTHMRTHTGEKPFQCDICQKSFSQRSSLLVHRKTH